MESFLFIRLPGFVLSRDLGVYDTGYVPLTSTSTRRPSQASLSPGRGKTKRYWSSGLCDAGSPDAFDTSAPSIHVLISRPPRLSVSRGGTWKWLPDSCREAPSFSCGSLQRMSEGQKCSTPWACSIPRPSTRRKPAGKRLGSEMACDPGVGLPCSQAVLTVGPMSHSGGRSRMAFSSLDKMEASSESSCPPNSLFQTKSYDVERRFCVMFGHPWKSLRGKFQNFAKASSEKPVPC